MRLLKVGRDLSCDIVLQSPRVSSLHAEITVLDNGDIFLEDKQSRNGTYIMNQPIRPNTMISIKRGDAIRFADIELQWNQIPMPEDNSMYRAVYSIGSDSKNEILLPGNTVSRFHATLKITKKGKAYITDHSKNGTTINGQRIKKNQAVEVKRGSSVVCGGVPCDINSYIPGSPARKIIAIAASVTVAAVIGILVWLLPDLIKVHPKDAKAMENASVCIYGEYYYEVSLKDNPFTDIGINKFTIGHDGKGNLVSKEFNCYCSSLKYYSGPIYPLCYWGSGFFISTKGEMGTNRHIAVPWEYSKQEHQDILKNFFKIVFQTNSTYFAEVSSYSSTEFNAKVTRAIASDIEISGVFKYFGVGLTNSKINGLDDLLSAQVIAESGDEKKDVALIRLNTRQTPQHIIDMGAWYDLNDARVDEKELDLQNESLTIIGYPGGELVSSIMSDGKELHPTMHKATVSRVADNNQMQIQMPSIGGFSGSPVIDKNHRLVGVLYGGYRDRDAAITYCCNIKHLKELYDKHCVKE